jgi:hypothetical protein
MALTPAEGFAIEGTAAARVGSSGWGPLLMAASGSASEVKRAPPDKRYWNEQERISADFGEKTGGSPIYREVELLCKKHPGGPLRLLVAA